MWRNARLTLVGGRVLVKIWVRLGAAEFLESEDGGTRNSVSAGCSQKGVNVRPRPRISPAHAQAVAATINTDPVDAHKIAEVIAAGYMFFAIAQRYPRATLRAYAQALELLS